MFVKTWRNSIPCDKVEDSTGSICQIIFFILLCEALHSICDAVNLSRLVSPKEAWLLNYSLSRWECELDFDEFYCDQSIFWDMFTSHQNTYFQQGGLKISGIYQIGMVDNAVPDQTVWAVG